MVFSPIKAFHLWPPSHKTHERKDMPTLLYYIWSLSQIGGVQLVRNASVTLRVIILKTVRYISSPPELCLGATLGFVFHVELKFAVISRVSLRIQYDSPLKARGSVGEAAAQYRKMHLHDHDEVPYRQRINYQ